MPFIGKKATTAPMPAMQTHKKQAVGAGVGGSEQAKYHDWLNPINKTILIAAFRAKAKQVSLDNREFTINYTKRLGYAWVMPKEGAKVPCGWFELDRSTSKDFFNG
jgi:hypothetical protein